MSHWGYDPDRYQRLKAAGICTNCGTKPARSNRTRCEECNRCQEISDGGRYHPEIRHQRYVETQELEDSQDKFRLRKYGLTRDMFDTLWMIQGGCCAICGEQFHEYEEGHQREHVDHDKVTGKVRGLLCNACNRGIGYLKHDPKIFHAAADYMMESV